MLSNKYSRCSKSSEFNPEHDLHEPFSSSRPWQSFRAPDVLMKALRSDAAAPVPGLSREPIIYEVPGWRVQHYPIATSTNLVAANLPAWTAVRADVQTSGRGRFERQWVSDRGGLWLSAVIPANLKTASSGVLPLVVGLAVCDSLRESGVSNLRMRWPNDVLVENRKLAGLLVDQFTPDLAVAGIGINVLNQPEASDHSLKNLTTRLADLLSAPPELFVLTARVLQHLRRLVLEFESLGFQSMLERVNASWGPAREVELDLDGQLRRGVLRGIDRNGWLLLFDQAGGETAYPAHQVRHLQEI